MSIDSDTLYSGLFENFGILPDTALLLVCEDNISAVIEIGQYFYGVTLVEDFDCLENIELLSIQGGVRSFSFG